MRTKTRATLFLEPTRLPGPVGNEKHPNRFLLSAVTGALLALAMLTAPAGLAAFDRLDARVLEIGEDDLESALIDPEGDFAYFGTNTSPGQVIKVGPAFSPRALGVDLMPFDSDGNGLLEPGELVDMAPAWRNNGGSTRILAGSARHLRRRCPRMLPGCSWGEAQPDGFESVKVAAIQGREGSATLARYRRDHAVDERPSTSPRLVEELGCGLGILFAVRDAIRHDPRCQLEIGDIERATQELGPRDGAHRESAAFLKPHPKHLVGIGAGD